MRSARIHHEVLDKQRALPSALCPWVTSSNIMSSGSPHLVLCSRRCWGEWRSLPCHGVAWLICVMRHLLTSNQLNLVLTAATPLLSPSHMVCVFGQQHIWFCCHPVMCDDGLDEIRVSFDWPFGHSCRVCLKPMSSNKAWLPIHQPRRLARLCATIGPYGNA